MNEAQLILQRMCERYQAAVNANDSAAYRKLFAADAIRVPPGSEPERGPEAIAASEQKDYDNATWNISSRALDALRIDADWLYGIAHVDAQIVAHADGAVKSIQATKTWLLQRQASGEWLIVRQMWNLK